jgi:hypothetical protein
MGKHARSSGHFRQRYPVLAVGALLAVAGVSSVLISGRASTPQFWQAARHPPPRHLLPARFTGARGPGEGSPLFRSPPRRPVRPGNTALPGRYS